MNALGAGRDSQYCRLLYWLVWQRVYLYLYKQFLLHLKVGFTCNIW